MTARPALNRRRRDDLRSRAARGTGVRLNLLGVALLLAVLAPRPGAFASEEASWRSAPQPCQVAGRSARCATMDVAEDRSSPDGRRLAIRVVVLPALDASERLEDPLVVLEGGPGSSVLAAAQIHLATFVGLHRRRDVVLVEQRGTGESAVLDCGLGATRLTAETASSCRARLSEQADLRFYGTHHAVLDLVAALDLLGYDRVNVFGVSYGTRTALELVRRHPERVRTVAMLGTYPPGRNAVLDAPAILDRSLALLEEACAADPPCHGAYPDLGASIEQLSRRLAAGELTSSRRAIGSTLRLMLFYPLMAAQVPRVIDALAKGDESLLAAAAAPTAGAFSAITDGAFLSLICSEDVARLDDSAVAAAGRGTLLEGTWGAELLQTCAGWARADVPGDFHDPLKTSTPILSLTGALDPSMPPTWGAELADSLTGARHLTIPEAQHGLLGMRGVGCIVALLQEFVEAGSAGELDTGCLEQVARPPFVVE